MPGYDAEFLALKVMKAWGKDPAWWREQDVDDRAMMMAFELFEGTCDSYRDQFSRDYHEKSGKRKAESGSRSNEFSAMKRELGMT
ncbi:MAG: hypothetical protein KGL39_50120 [Patescibacteria group bacterium]|nr:hypothetical protein [Patescibacteria group bacterium]